MLCSNCKKTIESYSDNCPFCGSALKRENSLVNANQSLFHIGEVNGNYTTMRSSKNESYSINNKRNEIFEFHNDKEKIIYTLILLSSTQTKEGRRRIKIFISMFVFSLIVALIVFSYIGTTSLTSKIIQFLFGAYFISFVHIMITYFPNPIDGALYDENKKIIGYLKHNLFHSQYNFVYENKKIVIITFENNDDQVINYSDLVFTLKRKKTIQTKLVNEEITSIFDKNKLIATYTANRSSELRVKIITTKMTV